MEQNRSRLGAWFVDGGGVDLLRMEVLDLVAGRQWWRCWCGGAGCGGEGTGGGSCTRLRTFCEFVWGVANLYVFHALSCQCVRSERYASIRVVRLEECYVETIDVKIQGTQSKQETAVDSKQAKYLGTLLADETKRS